MKSYDALKDEMRKFQQQMIAERRDECAYSLKEKKSRCKDLGFISGMHKGSLDGGRKKQ